MKGERGGARGSLESERRKSNVELWPERVCSLGGYRDKIENGIILTEKNGYISKTYDTH